VPRLWLDFSHQAAVGTDKHFTVVKPLIGIERYWYNNKNESGYQQCGYQ